MSDLQFCSKCGKNMVPRSGGKFLGCSGYPACKNTMSIRYTSGKPMERKEVKLIDGSDEQKSIWQAITDFTGHVIVRARAGCGKTSTIVQALQYIHGQSVIFVAFNKDIVTELESRLPEGMIAKTMNGFGFGIVRSAMKVQLNQYKLDDILKTLIHEDDRNLAVFSAIKQLVNLCKYNLLDGKNHEDLDMFASVHGIDLNNSIDLIYTLVPQVIELSKTFKVKGMLQIDFTDQLWFIFAHNLTVPTFGMVFGDEIQDWNKLQRYLMLKMIGNKGRFIGVGDDKQSIYGFAGADTHSIDNIIADVQKTNKAVKIMPLTVSWRCPVSHILYVNSIVDDIQHASNAIDGILEPITLELAQTKINAGDMIICRRNAPIISLAYMLIRQGKKVIVKGRDIGQNLITLINKLKADDISDLIDKAYDYFDKESEKLSKTKNADNRIQMLQDKIDTLVAMCDGMNSIKDLQIMINTLFSEDRSNDAILMSTVHKAKGLESSVVYIMDYKRIMLPMKDPDLAQQELNLKYISLTRSRNELYLID
jgi:DNA helicase-2/ATP-dependent DNA helicase PcrA